ncbi:MAG: hypothetical protein WAK72_29220, partial [Pseudolabrys sp.]
GLSLSLAAICDLPMCVSGALLIAGRESSTVSFVACSVSVCFSVSVGLIEPACFPVPVFGGLGGN